MTDVLARLRIQEACPKHQWGAAFPQSYGYGRERKSEWTVQCKLCQARYSRETLDKLAAEVLNV